MKTTSRMGPSTSLRTARAAGFLGVFLLAPAITGSLDAQTPEDPPAVERCVCIHGHWEEANEALREALERTREAAERSRELSAESFEGLAQRLRAQMDTLRIAFPTRIARARLGVELSTDPVEGVPDGVAIVRVTPRSGADDAGLRAGDVVIEVDGHDLGRPLPDETLREGVPAPLQRLQSLAAELEPGDTVRVRYLRDGEARTAEVEARRFPGMVIAGRAPSAGPRTPSARAPVQIWPAPPAPPPGPGVRIGRQRIDLTDLNPGLARYFGTEEGALVLHVPADAALDLQAGDVVTGIDGRTVRNAGDARRILASYRPGETVSIEIRREGRTLTVSGEVPE